MTTFFSTQSSVLSPRTSVYSQREFAAEANRLFGDQTYYATVDTSLPERKMKVWEKKSTNGDEE